MALESGSASPARVGGRGGASDLWGPANGLNPQSCWGVPSSSSRQGPRRGDRTGRMVGTRLGRSHEGTRQARGCTKGWGPGLDTPSQRAPGHAEWEPLKRTQALETQGEGKAASCRGAGSGRARPGKGLPARPWPPWAECLFPPAHRRQSRPGKEPRQVRAGPSPPSGPRPEKGFLPTRARSRQRHQRAAETESYRERQSYRETETDTRERQSGKGRHSSKTEAERERTETKRQ